MVIPEELQRRIEKSLADGGFTPAEMLLRRAHRLALDKTNGSGAAADTMLKEAGLSIRADDLSAVIEKKPWLLEVILQGVNRKPGDTGDHH
ncbi:hypothetical protein [Ochrobactrum teleogrylli]|uniref:Uncharacterized protein n=1 Tax=Ochrobactrum teleogrylli TaxID=2479765 RepID=A0ABD5JRP6_9HYPH